MEQRGLIVTPLAQAADLAWLEGGKAAPEDRVLCADGGYEAALALGLKPEVLIGDMDSLISCDQVACPQIRYPVAKDEPDSLLCLREGKRRGLARFVILGGMGGRMDHTYANIQVMAYGLEEGLEVAVTGQDAWARLLPPGRYSLSRREGMKLSLFAYTPKVTGLTLEGTLFPLREAELRQSFPLGLSNAFMAKEAIISFRQGLLLAMLAVEN